MNKHTPKFCVGCKQFQTCNKLPIDCDSFMGFIHGKVEDRVSQNLAKSDGSTASYYELPEGCKELQDLISYRDMNSQIGEIFRACFRYGKVEHSEKLRDAKKILFYAKAEIDRLEKYESGEQVLRERLVIK